MRQNYQQRRLSTLSLCIGLWLAILSSVMQGATSQISDVELCACSPRVYELTFDFDLECEPINVDFDSGGIADATCHVNGFDNINVTDLVPVAVSSVQLIEIGQGGTPIAVQQYTGDYRDGDKIEYTSISFEGAVVPRAFQVRALGRNEGGDPLVLQWAVTYSNNCGVWPVLELNDSVGWTIFTGLARPLAIACPAVIPPPETDEPTASPTASPTKSPTLSPTISPTIAPTGSTPSPTKSPTLSPTVTPTLSPTLSPTIAPTGLTPNPTFSPSSSPTDGPTLSPTDPPTGDPTPSPTKAPTLSPTPPAPTEPPTVPETLMPTIPEMSFSYSFSYDFSWDEMEELAEEPEFGRGDPSEDEEVEVEPPCRRRKVRKVRRVRKNRALLAKGAEKKKAGPRHTPKQEVYGENSTLPVYDSDSADEHDMGTPDDHPVYESKDDPEMALDSMEDPPLHMDSEEDAYMYEEVEDIEEIVVCPGDELYEVSEVDEPMDEPDEDAYTIPSSTSKGKGGKGYAASTSKGSTSKGSTSKGSTSKGSTSKGSTTKGSTSKGSTSKGSSTASKGKGGKGGEMSLKDKRPKLSSKGSGSSKGMKSRLSADDMGMTGDLDYFESDSADGAEIEEPISPEDDTYMPAEDDAYGSSSKGSSKGSSTSKGSRSKGSSTSSKGASTSSKGTSSKGTSSKGASTSSKGASTRSKGKSVSKKSRPSGKGMSMTSKGSGSMMEASGDEDDDAYMVVDDAYELTSKGSKGSKGSGKGGSSKKLSKKEKSADSMSRLRNGNKLSADRY